MSDRMVQRLGFPVHVLSYAEQILHISRKLNLILDLIKALFELQKQIGWGDYHDRSEDTNLYILMNRFSNLLYDGSESNFT
jgi:hypothetical protein